MWHVLTFPGLFHCRPPGWQSRCWHSQCQMSCHHHESQRSPSRPTHSAAPGLEESWRNSNTEGNRSADVLVLGICVPHVIMLQVITAHLQTKSWMIWMLICTFLNKFVVTLRGQVRVSYSGVLYLSMIVISVNKYVFEEACWWVAADEAWFRLLQQKPWKTQTQSIIIPRVKYFISSNKHCYLAVKESQHEQHSFFFH